MEEERKREHDIEMEMQRKRDQMKWLQHVSEHPQLLTTITCFFIRVKKLMPRIVNYNMTCLLHKMAELLFQSIIKSVQK